MYQYFRTLPEIRLDRFFQITCACFMFLAVSNIGFVYAQGGNFHRLSSHNAQTRVNKLKGSSKQSPVRPYSPWNRNLDYIYHPNGRSVQFAPPEGQLLSRRASGQSNFNPVSNFFVIPEVEIICSADGICGPSRAPAPAAFLRGPTSTGASSNARFASYSASLSYQKPGTFRVMVPRRAENIYINKFLLGSSPTTSAPVTVATAALPATATTPAERVTAAGSLYSSAPLFSLTKSDEHALPKSHAEFKIMLRTLFGW